ncbi:hypothetical protein TNCV_4414771 [Trichonephila clavipes]|uniref:Uncharacterized protein n=1 Tax=Trichonephila clavipes TaxID=2585209 RepID=A0A8X6VEE6_TRICX|nr:hypothetical protein TNCV_4414771 [Trichonephila clavipes]
MLEFIRSQFLHITGLSEGHFPRYLCSWLDNFYKAAGVPPLIFLLTPEKKPAFISNLISIPDHQKNYRFKVQGRVHHKPLVISHWPAHKSLDTTLGLISVLLVWS